MVAQIWINTGSGNGLLPDDIKPLPEPVLNINGVLQSSKLAGSPKSEASEIMLQTSETILALVQSD